MQEQYKFRVVKHSTKAINTNNIDKKLVIEASATDFNPFNFYFVVYFDGDKNLFMI